MVFRVGRGKRVGGEIVTSPGIHVGVDGSLEHIEERITDGVFLASTASEVLKDVRTASVIFRQGLDDGSEGVIGVIILDVVNHGT